MTWLVTGGAGYIGAHVGRAFRAAGEQVVVIDSLSSGHASFVPAEVPFVRGTLLDGDLVRHTLRDHDVTGVVHLAGFKYAGVSVSTPLLTYQQNVTGTATLLELAPAAPVLVAREMTYDQAGRPFDLGAITYRGDRYRFQVRSRDHLVDMIQEQIGEPPTGHSRPDGDD